MPSSLTSVAMWQQAHITLQLQPIYFTSAVMLAHITILIFRSCKPQSIPPLHNNYCCSTDDGSLCTRRGSNINLLYHVAHPHSSKTIATHQVYNYCSTTRSFIIRLAILRMYAVAPIARTGTEALDLPYCRHSPSSANLFAD